MHACMHARYLLYVHSFHHPIYSNTLPLRLFFPSSKKEKRDDEEQEEGEGREKHCTAEKSYILKQQTRGKKKRRKKNRTDNVPSTPKCSCSHVLMLSCCPCHMQKNEQTNKRPKRLSKRKRWGSLYSSHRIPKKPKEQFRGYPGKKGSVIWYHRQQIKQARQDKEKSKPKRQGKMPTEPFCFLFFFLLF